jgi:hypothetical protein
MQSIPASKVHTTVNAINYAANKTVNAYNKYGMETKPKRDPACKT